MNLVKKGKRLLIENGYTFVALKNDEIYSSNLHGIKPLMSKVFVSNDYFKGYTVIDRVVGRAAALLLIRSKVKYIHGIVLSKPAKELLEEYHINYSYDQLVPYITSRDKKRMCSLEVSISNISGLEHGFKVLCKEVVEKSR